MKPGEIQPALIACAVGWAVAGPVGAQTSEPEATASEINRTVEATAAVSGREFVVMPIPVSNPSIGSGLALAAMALYAPDEGSPPWASGVGAVYTDSGSWAVGVFQKANLSADRIRLTLAAGTGDFHLDFYGVGADAGSRDVSVAIEQATDFASGRLLFRIGNHAYVGALFRYMAVSASLDLGDFDLPVDLEIPPLQLESRTAGLGLAAEYDSRDSEYGPTRGLHGSMQYLVSDEGFGSDFDYGRFEAALNAYQPLHEATVIAGRISVCAAGDGAPFYDLCSFGQNADLRGYAAGRYRDHALVAGQVELRRRFGRRFGGVVFAGVGGVAPSLSSLGEQALLPAAGIGVRYRASETYGVNLAVDYAVGRDSHALYFRIGEAF